MIDEEETKILSLPPRLFEPDGRENLPPPPPAQKGLVIDLEDDRGPAPTPSAESMVEPSSLVFMTPSTTTYLARPLLSDEQIKVLTDRINSLEEGHVAVVRTKLVDLALTAPTAKKGVELALRVISGAVGLFP